MQDLYGRETGRFTRTVRECALPIGIFAQIEKLRREPLPPPPPRKICEGTQSNSFT